MGILCLVLRVAYYGLIVWIILGYVVNFGRLPYDHPVAKIYQSLASAINPLLAPIRRVIPPVRMGNAGLDLSPLVLFFAIWIVSGFIC